MRGRWGGWGLPGLALLTGLLLAAFPAQSQYIASYNSLQQNGSSVSGYLATDLAGFVWCPEEYSDYGEEGCVYYYDAIVFGQLLLNSGVVDSSSEVYEYDMLSEAYLYAEVPSGDNYFQLSATHGVEYCLGPWSWTWRTQWGFSNEFLATQGPPEIPGFDFDVDNPSSLYSYIALQGGGGGSATAVQSQMEASGVLYNTNSPLTTDNLNINGVGYLAGTGEDVNPALEGYVQQMGYSFLSPMVPSVNPAATTIPWLINVYVIAGTTIAAGAIAIASCLLMTGDHPAGWDPSRAAQCEAQQAADDAECERRFLSSGQWVKLKACKAHSWLRHSLCMKNQPVSPLQPEY